jgi:hypothetical protein
MHEANGPARWGPAHYRGRPWWGGWGGPRIVNNVVIKQTTVVNVGDIRYHNATLPRAILTVPTDKFGRERVRATVENRYRHTEFAPVRGELPVKPTRASLYGGAPKGAQPPRDVAARPVVSTRTPRERTQPLQDAIPRARQAVPESRYVIPPVRRSEDRQALPRPAFGAEAGPERAPQPRPPRYEEMRKPVTPPAVPPRSQTTTREQATVPSQTTTREQAAEHRQATPAPRPAQPAVAPQPTGRPSTPAGAPTPRARTEVAPQRGEVRQGGQARPLPGQPASQTYRRSGRDGRDAR